MGYPTKYKGNTFTWRLDRKLISGTMNGKSFSYNYDGNGMRYVKNANGVKTSYYYNGTQLLMESKNRQRTWFVYGVTGIEGIIVDLGYREDTYYFDKNTLGDVVALRDTSGNIVATYEYDAWGNCTVMNANGTLNTSTTFIGNMNPIRYRGYYYDTETGFYYLQTRYYDPTICRFINADNYELVAQLSGVAGQLNMYAYCNNNPIMYVDPSGHAAISLFAGLIIGCLVSWGLSELFGEHLVTGTGLAITGGSAVVSGIMAMTLATPVGCIVGGVTAVAGLCTLAFASAELQQHFTGDNWMLDGGRDQGTYYTLMTISSIIASVGTAASSVAYHYKINTVTQTGRINGKMVSGTDIDGYSGLRFSSKTGKVYSLECHPNHNNHGLHIQWNQWFTTYPKFPGEYVLNPLWRLRLW